VLPSTDEPWGLVANEAIRFGLPLVLSDAVGSAPVLLDGNGASFDPARPDHLREALLKVLANKAEMSARSLELAATYTAERQARDMLAALRLPAARGDILPNAAGNIAR
jgi:glycosyltransferase involved in cell wall biosynthesis